MTDIENNDKDDTFNIIDKLKKINNNKIRKLIMKMDEERMR